MKSYKEINFPRTRIATLDVCEIGRKKHHMRAMLELDVTETRSLIKAYRNKTKNKISFTGWLIKTISKTIEEIPQIHAYLKTKSKAYIFNDIDISLAIEREYDGEMVPLPYVIRKTNIKNMVEISIEIENAKTKTILKEDIVLGQRKNRILTNLYYFLPGISRRYFWKCLMKNPIIAQKNMGSVMVTSIGMVGNINGWFIYTSIHPISFGISSIVKKPAVVEDRIEIREILNMTVLMDHDVVDGIPMARFVKMLVKNVETGLGLT
jgi:pyruvate/2-oxoglutarate dehydrogenase complex dihydrolipoamide acyltransferase (E2) component